VSGDPTKATAALGRVFLQIKVDNAVAQIQGLMSGTLQPVAPAAGREGRGGRGGGDAAARGGAAGAGRGDAAARGGAAGAGRGNAGGAGRSGATGTARGGDQGRGRAAGQPSTPPAPRRPTMETAPAGISPTRPPDTVFIDELTWEETRDLMKAGATTAIVPIGGTEKNGYHMVLGKHNYVVTHAANLMARRLGKTLVAPTIQYVPEGNPDRAGPGVISHPSPAYNLLLDAAARSLQAHGFTRIIFIGDSGGNQAGMTAVADALNAEWQGTGTRVFALTDYYTRGREHYRAWLLAAHGYDDETIGSHAGISDTSQLLFVHPAGVRKNQIKPWGGARDSGVSGDPSKASAAIGKMGIEFKVNAAIAQLR
jgi:creatinine amidohydrolase/Fe(II)-dependent formamide hydrolase-like protein